MCVRSPRKKKEWPDKTRNGLYEVWLLSFQLGPNSDIISGTMPKGWAEVSWPGQGPFSPQALMAYFKILCQHEDEMGFRKPQNERHKPLQLMIQMILKLVTYKIQVRYCVHGCLLSP